MDYMNQHHWRNDRYYKQYNFGNTLTFEQRRQHQLNGETYQRGNVNETNTTCNSVEPRRRPVDQRTRRNNSRWKPFECKACQASDLVKKTKNTATQYEPPEAEVCSVRAEIQKIYRYMGTPYRVQSQNREKCEGPHHTCSLCSFPPEVNGSDSDDCCDKPDVDCPICAVMKTDKNNSAANSNGEKHIPLGLCINVYALRHTSGKG